MEQNQKGWDGNVFQMVYGRGVKLNQTRGQNPKHTLVRRQTGFTEEIKTESFF